MPDYPVESEKGGHGYIVRTSSEKMVADYCHISLFDVEEMNYIEYLSLCRDAFISKLNETESGREYLANAFRLEQTDMDTTSLREHFS